MEANGMDGYEQLLFLTGWDGGFIGTAELAAVKKFLALCARGSASEIRSALDGGASAAWADEHGRTPLMAAAQFNSDPQAVRELLLAESPVNARDGMGMTALMLAAREGAAASAAMLISAGADAGARDLSGRTALMHAAAYSRDGIAVDVLLRSGADLAAAAKNGMTALMYAVKQTSPDARVVRILLLAGADPNASGGGWTPLCLAAAYNRNSETVDLLLGAGAKRPSGEDEFLLYTRALQQNALMPDREKTALAERLFRGQNG